MNFKKMHFFGIFFPKNLDNWKNYTTFAPEFGIVQKRSARYCYRRKRSRKGAINP